MGDKQSKADGHREQRLRAPSPIEGTCPRCSGPALFREALDGLAGACTSPLCGWTSTAVAGFGPPRG